jgi:hypothetical protein
MAEAIRADDVGQMQEIIQERELDINGQIQPSLFARMQEGPITFVEYAGLFGSRKCFRYFMVNDADIRECAGCAVRSDSIEIISALEDQLNGKALAQL